MHKVGPFRLVSILMHNGLNGRGTAWAVVRGDDGRWWKIVDLVKEEVTLEQALADPSGLMMNAGATFLLYQKMDEVEECEVPMSLKVRRIGFSAESSEADNLAAVCRPSRQPRLRCVPPAFTRLDRRIVEPSVALVTRA